MFSLIAGLIPGRAALYAGVAVAALAAGGYALHRHTVSALEAQAAKEQAVAIATINADHARAIAALQIVASQAQARADSSTNIRTAAHAAPSSTSCSRSPSVLAAIPGLRQRAVAGSGAARGSK